MGDTAGGRRLVGLDLGIATAHTAQVLDDGGQVRAKRRVHPRAESFAALEAAALAGADTETRLEVVIGACQDFCVSRSVGGQFR